MAGWLGLLVVLSLASPILSQADSSSTIPTAGSVSLINGNGDMDPKGAPRCNKHWMPAGAR